MTTVTPDDKSKGDRFDCKDKTTPQHYVYYKPKLIQGSIIAAALSGETETKRVYLTCDLGHTECYEVKVLK